MTHADLVRFQRVYWIEGLTSSLTQEADGPVPPPAPPRTSTSQMSPAADVGRVAQQPGFRPELQRLEFVLFQDI